MLCCCVRVLRTLALWLAIVAQAYDLLSDPDSRAVYDDFGDDGEEVSGYACPPNGVDCSGSLL